MCDHEFYLDAIRKKITGDPSRARPVWNNLRKSHKEALLNAAGLPESMAANSWDQFTTPELKVIYDGVRKLRVINAVFATCREQDFKQYDKPVKKITVDDELRRKAELVNQIKH